MFDKDDFEEQIDAMVNRLMSMGLIEVTGIDAASGEFLYQVSPDLYAMFPDLKSIIHESFIDQVNSLWVKGFLSMDYTELNPMVSLTDNAFDEKKVALLSLDERNALMLIMDAMRMR